MSFRIVNKSLNGQVGGWPAQIPNIQLGFWVWSSQVLSTSFIPQYFYLKHLKGIPVNPTFASYEANKYHTAKSGVILTWALFVKAPRRYHITIVLPSPRIMVGLSRCIATVWLTGMSRSGAGWGDLGPGKAKKQNRQCMYLASFLESL